MDGDMDSTAQQEQRRKQAGPRRARGRAGYRHLEAVLEAANLVVQRVDTENDIGRDAFVDIVQGTDVTGGVVCVQVKAGRASYFHDGRWLIPGTAADFTLWRESTVPCFGITYDDATAALRWVDLSEAATLTLDPFLSPVVVGPFGKRCVPVPEENRLDLEIEPFLKAAEGALRRRSGTPVGVLERDVERVRAAITDCFAMGRHNGTPFLLLAAVLQRLPKEVLRYAIGALAMTTSHPDVPWTKSNWVPDNVCRFVRERISWSDADVVALLGAIDEGGIQRGSFGQTVFHVLDLDRDLQPKLFRVAVSRWQPDAIRMWAAAILLYFADGKAAATLEALIRVDRTQADDGGLFPLHRPLEQVAHFNEIAAQVEQFGYVPLF